MSWDQVALGLTGVIAILLSQDARPERARFACLFGLAGQPFWFYTSYTHQQWGVFALCFMYSFGWLRGWWRHFGRAWWARQRACITRDPLWRVGSWWRKGGRECGLYLQLLPTPSVGSGPGFSDRFMSAFSLSLYRDAYGLNVEVGGEADEIAERLAAHAQRAPVSLKAA